MATWASLTDEHKNDVESLANAIRGACVTFSALAHQAEVIGAAWNGGISTIVGSLDSGEIVPQTSGYAGSRTGTASARTDAAVGPLGFTRHSPLATGKCSMAAFTSSQTGNWSSTST